ncbi:MAG: nucleotidyltransferase domain-containing protein, partial [Nanoarchaeota archaeon]|nr:nucleotidyltransferase domain-containing protein [Nanoarchaeota archaeon]
MLTKEEIKIIDLFRGDLLKDYTIREIMKKTGKKSYNWTFKAIKKLNKCGIINFKKKGHSNVSSPNLNNILTLVYLSLLEELNINSKKLPNKNISELIDSIPLSYFTFIIAGSYATGKAGKGSDLDAVILIEDGISAKKILT